VNVRLGTRIRRVVVVLLVVLGLASVGPPSAVAGTPATYLALGDSVPFGFRLLADPAPYGNPDNFVGYPEIIARDLGLNLLNASCPGESTDSFIDYTQPSNGCENFYRAKPFPLHVDYLGAQLAYAVHVLETTPNVKLVTVQLGANDGFLCQASTADGCTSPAEIAALASHIRANMAVILRTLRQTGYAGRIVAVTYYSPNYADPVLTGQVLAINSAITLAALLTETSIASGFLAFLGPSLRAGGSPVAAGLTLSLADIHPTAAGQRLLATTVERALRL
jgi:lysophospholipase L1-like esterase